VDDDGPGIAQGDLVRVFERFYRADRGPNRELGSGLGLAIVSELAAAMGGTVRAESPITDRGGSRFVLTLQRWPQPVPEPVAT
jgi:signal transduction histidine kinase